MNESLVVCCEKLKSGPGDVMSLAVDVVFSEYCKSRPGRADDAVIRVARDKMLMYFMMSGMYVLLEMRREEWCERTIHACY